MTTILWLITTITNFIFLTIIFYSITAQTIILLYATIELIHNNITHNNLISPNNNNIFMHTIQQTSTTTLVLISTIASWSLAILFFLLFHNTLLLLQLALFLISQAGPLSTTLFWLQKFWSITQTPINILCLTILLSLTTLLTKIILQITINYLYNNITHNSKPAMLTFTQRINAHNSLATLIILPIISWLLFFFIFLIINSEISYGSN